MRFPTLLALLCLGASATVAADDAPAPGIPDFSVLTPSMDGHFFVSTQVNLNQIHPLLGGPGDIANQVRTKQLRRIVAKENYDPARTIADRLVERLAAAGYSAAYEPIAREPQGSVQSLAWSDLPGQLQGAFVLDLNINWICLCSSTSYMKTYPSIAIRWRVLDPPQQVLLPSRNLVYFHIPWDPPKRRAPAAGAKPDEPPPYPPVTVSEGCGFGSLDEAEENPARLWGCFGEAYDVALERLVIDLKRLRPPAGAVTASGGSPSGRSTQ